MKIKLKFIIVLFIITAISFNFTKKAEAIPVSDIVAHVKATMSDIKRHTDDVKSYITTAKNLVQTTKSAVAMAKNLKNFSFQSLAHNLGGDQIMETGDFVLKAMAGDQGAGVNTFTNGSQIITDLQGFIDDVGINELKKSIQEFDNPENTSPYQLEIKKAIMDFSKDLADKANGKLINFTLPYIVRAEICNSAELKEVIKKGEPKTYTIPKPPVNIDIETVCKNTKTVLSAKDQAIFIGLAKGGYGGEKTNIAMSEPKNLPSSVINNVVNTILEKKSEKEEVASKQVEATGLNAGNSVCFDKNGNKVKYDPASKDPKKKLCYSTDSTPEGSGSVAKDRNSAALLAPYFSMLAKSFSIEKNKGCGKKTSFNPSSINSNKIVENTNSNNNFLLKFFFTTANAENVEEDIKAATAAAGQAAGQTAGQTTNKDPNIKDVPANIKESADKTMKDLDDKLKANTGAEPGKAKDQQALDEINCTLDFLNNIIGTVNSVVSLGVGGNNLILSAANGEDSPYTRLYQELNNSISTQIKQSQLGYDAALSDRNYEMGIEDTKEFYTIADLKAKLELYTQMRELNTQILNSAVFTYAFIDLDIRDSKYIIPTFPGIERGKGWGTDWDHWDVQSRQLNTYLDNVKKAVNDLFIIEKNLSKNIKSLIKEMANNNYKEQQIIKLLNLFEKTPNTREQDNQDAMKKALDGTISSNAYQLKEAAWSYELALNSRKNTSFGEYVELLNGNKDEGEERNKGGEETWFVNMAKKSMKYPFTEQERSVQLNEMLLATIKLKAMILFEASVIPKENDNFMLFLPRPFRVTIPLNYSNRYNGTLYTNLFEAYAAIGDRDYNNTYILMRNILEKQDNLLLNSNLFPRYGMLKIKDIDLNMPPETILNSKITPWNILEPESTKKWSEMEFCKKLGLENTVCKGVSPEITAPNVSTGNGGGTINPCLNTYEDPTMMYYNNSEVPCNEDSITPKQE